MNERKNRLKCELYNDSMQGWKCYPIQKAQLIIADIPYNVGNNFYGSNPMWYKGGITKTAKASWQAKRHPLCSEAQEVTRALYFHLFSEVSQRHSKTTRKLMQKLLQKRSKRVPNPLTVQL